METARLGREELEFFKRVYLEQQPRQARLDELSDQVSAEQLEQSKFSGDQAEAQWKRFNEVFVPVEDRMVKEANEIDSGAELDRKAGEAAAGVQSQYDAGVNINNRNLAAMGVNPNSSRALAVKADGALKLAAAKAGAANNAREIARDKGISLRAGVANFGRNMPNTAATAYGTALAAGNSSVSNTQAPMIAANQNAAMMGQGFSGAIGAQQGAGNLFATASSQRQSAAQANIAQSNSQSQGMGQLIGMGAMLAMSSKDVKTDKKPVDDDEILEAIRDTDVEEWRYKDGEGDGGKHIGPYAEDVQKNLGDDVAPKGKVIDVVSMMGAHMSGIKALDKKVGKIERKLGSGNKKKGSVRRQAQRGLSA